MTTPPFWMTFPTQDIKADWNDHSAAHRAVMALYEEALPGPVRERRATGQILYRVDHHLDGSSSVLVQSQHPLEKAPPSARATTVPTASWAIPAGSTVLFRVAVNPVRRRTERDESGRRHEILSSIGLDEVPAWVAAKLDGALQVDEVLGHTRTTSSTRRRTSGTPPRFVIDTLDGVATVTDDGALQALRLQGVGRGKAYGAGLLTVRRLS